MSKKKAEKSGQAKRHGTLIRVADVFAETVKRAASFENMSIAEFANTYLLPVVEKRFREAINKEARRMEDQE